MFVMEIVEVFLKIIPFFSLILFQRLISVSVLGPLILKDTNELVGVVSWSDGFPCHAKKKPGDYTNVANYRDWIQENCDDCLG